MESKVIVNLFKGCSFHIREIEIKSFEDFDDQRVRTHCFPEDFDFAHIVNGKSSRFTYIVHLP